MNAPALADFRRIVVKVGSSLLVDSQAGRLKESWLASLAADLAALHRDKRDILVVSSGAIALGRAVLKLSRGPLKLEDSQAAAAVGQIALARAWAELEAADMICRRAAALFDAGRDCGADANMAKLLASEATWHAADATFQTYGGFAFAREYDIERKWRESRLYQTAPISTNLILAYIGQHVLGMPRSY